MNDLIRKALLNKRPKKISSAPPPITPLGGGYYGEDKSKCFLSKDKYYTLIDGKPIEIIKKNADIGKWVILEEEFNKCKRIYERSKVFIDGIPHFPIKNETHQWLRDIINYLPFHDRDTVFNNIESFSSILLQLKEYYNDNDFNFEVPGTANFAERNNSLIDTKGEIDQQNELSDNLKPNRGRSLFSLPEFEFDTFHFDLESIEKYYEGLDDLTGSQYLQWVLKETYKKIQNPFIYNTTKEGTRGKNISEQLQRLRRGIEVELEGRKTGDVPEPIPKQCFGTQSEEKSTNKPPLLTGYKPELKDNRSIWEPTLEKLWEKMKKGGVHISRTTFFSKKYEQTRFKYIQKTNDPPGYQIHPNVLKTLEKL